MGSMKFTLKSKTHVTALVMGIIGLLPILEGSIDPEYYPWIMVGFSLLSIHLRNITKVPIDQK
jgi:hypothetical protein